MPTVDGGGCKQQAAAVGSRRRGVSAVCSSEVAEYEGVERRRARCWASVVERLAGRDDYDCGWEADCVGAARRLCVPDREYCPRVITYELATAWSPYCPTGFCEQNVSYFSSFFSILSE
jgi:hypothetical protein